MTNYIKWTKWKSAVDSEIFWDARNESHQLLGRLHLVCWGRHTHWSWRQEDLIDMSPSCLEEVRKKQKELWKDRKR